MSDILAYWNNRAALGPAAGTQDRGLVALEQKIIREHVRPGMRVLDVGCGLGETLSTLKGIEAVGIDFSPAMVKAARSAHPAIRFEQADILDILPELGMFDLIYTQRCLINLQLEQQGMVVRAICSRLKRGGVYVAVEHSALGLTALNLLRRQVGLSDIEAPWHNVYLSEIAIRELSVADAVLEADAVDFSSTYYVMSRVINAWLAKRDGREPAYDAPINQLALQLPAMGHFGQARYWRWRKTA